MDDHSARNARFGAALLLTLIVASSSVGYLIWTKLYERKERYHILFADSVTGLEVGTGARMLGVHVGQVEDIAVDQFGERVIVTLALTPGTPITEHTLATMTPVGVTGLQFIELQGGTERSRRIEPDTPKSFIRAGATVLRTLMKQGRRIAEKADLLQGQLLRLATASQLRRFRGVQQSARRLAGTIDELRGKSTTRARRISRNVKRMAGTMRRASRALRRMRLDAGKHLPAASQAVMSAILSLEKVLSSVDPGPTERALARAATAKGPRLPAAHLDSLSKKLSAAGDQLGRVSDALARSVSKNDRQWTLIKKKLARAGRLISQLKRRYTTD